MHLKLPLAALLVAALSLPVVAPAPAFGQKRAMPQRAGGGNMGAANRANLPGKPQASARGSVNRPTGRGGSFSGHGGPDHGAGLPDRGHNNVNRPNNRPNRGGNTVVAGNNVVVNRPAWRWSRP